MITGCQSSLPQGNQDLLHSYTVSLGVIDNRFGEKMKAEIDMNMMSKSA